MPKILLVFQAKVMSAFKHSNKLENLDSYLEMLEKNHVKFGINLDVVKD